MPSQAWQHGSKTPLFTSCLQVRSLKTRRASPTAWAHPAQTLRTVDPAQGPASAPQRQQGHPKMSLTKAKRSQPAPQQKVAQPRSAGKGSRKDRATHMPPQSGTPESLLAMRLRPARRAVARKARPQRKFEHLTSANAGERMHLCLTSGEGALSGAAWLQRTILATCLGARPTHTHSKAPIPQIPALTVQLLHAALSPRHARRPRAPKAGCRVVGGGEGPHVQPRPGPLSAHGALGADDDLQSPFFFSFIYRSGRGWGGQGQP